MMMVVVQSGRIVGNVRNMKKVDSDSVFYLTGLFPPFNMPFVFNNLRTHGTQVENYVACFLNTLKSIYTPCNDRYNNTLEWSLFIHKNNTFYKLRAHII